MFDYPKADLLGLCDYLLLFDFTLYSTSNDIEVEWSTLKQIIYHGMDLFIPKVRLRSHQRPKWITSSLQHDINCLRTIRKRSESHPTPLNFTKLQSSESLLEEKLKAAKSSYENSVALDLASSKSHKIYNYIRSLSSKSSLPPSMHFDSFSAKNDYDKAQLFNKYFHSIFTQSSFTLPPISKLPSVVSLISDIFIPESDVFSELSLLDTSKTMGINNIGPKIL